MIDILSNDGVPSLRNCVVLSLC